MYAGVCLCLQLCLDRCGFLKYVGPRGVSPYCSVVFVYSSVFLYGCNYVWIDLDFEWKGLVFMFDGRVRIISY